MFDNMLQLMRFSVYFKRILNKNNGYFPIKITISAAHMLGGSWTCSLRTFLKKMQLGVFGCFFAYYIRAPQTRSVACYMRPYSGPFLSFLAYRGSLRSVSSHRIWGPPQISFLTYYGGLDPYVFFYTIWRPLGSFLCILYWGPRSLSSLNIWGPSDQFLLIQYGGPSQISFIVYYIPPPQIRFFACYRGATSD